MEDSTCALRFVVDKAKDYGMVAYAQNVRLQDALAKAGARSELFTIPGGLHGNFKPEERTKAYLKIREFLGKNGFAASVRPAQPSR